MPVARAIALTVLLVADGCTCAPPAKEGASRPDAGSAQPVAVAAQPLPLPHAARGMWVWKTRARLSDPTFKSGLLETCRRAGLNEVYLSVSGGALDDALLPDLMAALHAIGVRVEALMGEAVWYQPDKRAPMHAVIAAVASYNDRHREAGFAGIHLDIEPHQLAENRKAHDFLPALAEALTEAARAARSSDLSTSADLPRFALEEQGPAFARAVPRPFVMLYELRDRSSERLVTMSTSVVGRTYAGIGPGVPGALVVGLSVDDYPGDLEAMLAALESAQGKDPRYGGWAIHDEAKFRARAAASLSSP